ncbi:MAG: DUF6338 family protein [Pseudonocardiales bacterium]
MPSTFQALAVLILALLPGALYTWAFERQAGAWTIKTSDRVLRFVGASALLQVLATPVIYQLYRKFVVTGWLREGRPLPWWVWLFVAAFVGVPVALGRLVGTAAHNRTRWGRWFAGEHPAPRAWDNLFSTEDLTGWVRLRMKSEATWILGAYGSASDGSLRSYAAGYPHPQDLYLVDTAEADADGQFVVDDDGNVRMRGVGVLVRWKEVEYLEFIET